MLQWAFNITLSAETKIKINYKLNKTIDFGKI